MWELFGKEKPINKFVLCEKKRGEVAQYLRQEAFFLPLKVVEKMNSGIFVTLLGKDIGSTYVISDFQNKHLTYILSG